WLHTGKVIIVPPDTPMDFENKTITYAGIERSFCFPYTAYSDADHAANADRPTRHPGNGSSVLVYGLR
ncbi:MAG: hypothetical protein AAGI44_18580, partial [Pseudomonadota bacterium]